jgi:hypothetical protein
MDGKDEIVTTEFEFGDFDVRIIDEGNARTISYLPRFDFEAEKLREKGELDG